MRRRNYEVFLEIFKLRFFRIIDLPAFHFSLLIELIDDVPQVFIAIESMNFIAVEASSSFPATRAASLFIRRLMS